MAEAEDSDLSDSVKNTLKRTVSMMPRKRASDATVKTSELTLPTLDQQSVLNHETVAGEATTDEVVVVTDEEVVVMTDEEAEDTMTGEAAVMTDEEAEEEDSVVSAAAEVAIEMVDEVVDEMIGGEKGPEVVTDEIDDKKNVKNDRQT